MEEETTLLQAQMIYRTKLLTQLPDIVLKEICSNPSKKGRRGIRHLLPATFGIRHLLAATFGIRHILAATLDTAPISRNVRDTVPTSCDVWDTARISCDVLVTAPISCDVWDTAPISCEVRDTAPISCDVRVTAPISCDVRVTSPISCDEIDQNDETAPNNVVEQIGQIQEEREASFIRQEKHVAEVSPIEMAEACVEQHSDIEIEEGEMFKKLFRRSRKEKMNLVVKIAREKAKEGVIKAKDVMNRAKRSNMQ